MGHFYCRQKPAKDKITWQTPIIGRRDKTMKKIKQK
jgi:hypothetical protein